MDAVQQANSGHPGMPMGMAEIAEVLWNRHLRHNPADPQWPDRDRFVLSNGHGSMLLYALLHLTGYALPMEELRRFRQLHSKTPGHPEYGCAPGVETTTGPLGQGLANAVGMALAERMLAAEFNRDGFDIVDHRTYVFSRRRLPDGRHLARGLLARRHARARQADRLYDDNGISIDSEKASMGSGLPTTRPKRFEAYGWQVIPGVDGHDAGGDRRGDAEGASAETDRPSLICCKTVIGKGAPKKANTGAAHGAPLGAEEVAATRAAHRLAARRRSRFPKTSTRGWDARAKRRAARGRWNETVRGLREGAPGSRGGVRAAHGGRAAGRLAGAVREPPRSQVAAQSRDHRHAQGLAERARSAGAAAARTDRRLGRPRRLQPDDVVGLASRWARAAAATTCSTACASSAWRRSSTASRCMAG